MTALHRGWTFIHNSPNDEGKTDEGEEYLDDNVPKWDKRTMQYLCYVKQRGKECKRWHWQGYVQFKAAGGVRKKQAVERLGGQWKPKEGELSISLQAQRGTAEEAQKYVTEDEKQTSIGEVYEHGVFDASVGPNGSGQGTRTDLKIVMKEIIEKGMTEWETAQEWRDLWQRMHKPLAAAVKKADEKVPILETHAEGKEGLLQTYPHLRTVDTAIELYFKAKDTRRVLWIWSHEPKRGKSQILMYWYNEMVKQGKRAFKCGDGIKSADAAHIYEGQPYVFIDMGRSVREVPWSFIEGVKNNFVTTGKYNGKNLKLREQGMVVVAANIAPNSTDLSEDRYVDSCYCLDEAAVPAGAAAGRGGREETKEEADLEIQW